MDIPSRIPWSLVSGAAIHKQKVYGFSSRIPQGLASGAAIFMQKV